LKMLLLEAMLKKTGLLPAARAAVRWNRLLRNPAYFRQQQSLREEFVIFSRRYAAALHEPLVDPSRALPKALVVSVGFPSGIPSELGLIRGLEAAGFAPVVLTKWDPWILKYYRLARIKNLLFWDQFIEFPNPKEIRAALDPIRSSEDLLRYENRGIRIGRFAASTALRNLRVGSLNLQSPSVRSYVEQALVAGLMHAKAARKILQAVIPHRALFVDRGYTPQGEMFDACLSDGIDVRTWNTGHKSNTIILKRYTLQNRDDHPVSLSEQSWDRIRAMRWTEADRAQIHNEFEGTYASGDWYSEVGTQFNAHAVEASEIRKRLDLNPAKKTAIIFPHILWDGTFFWGKDLFHSYQQWFLETVRAACSNTSVNWIIKIHPANTVKNARDGIQGEPAELKVIQEAIGQLPPHLFILPANSEINTFSLLSVMDYCVTVRGTVGIEAATFGIPVLTAGTGRYDRKGFTLDSNSREQYLDRLSHIQEFPPLTPSQRELAERFAYGIFICRPLELETFTLEYQKDIKASIRTEIRARNREEWLNAPDIQAFARWINDPTQTDFLSLPSNQTEGTLNACAALSGS